VRAGWGVEAGVRTVAETGVVGGVCATGALASTGRRPGVRPGVAGVVVGGLATFDAGGKVEGCGRTLKTGGVGADATGGRGATFDAAGSVEGCGRMLKIGGLGARGGGLGNAVAGGCGRAITPGFAGVCDGAFATGTYTGLGGAPNPDSQPTATGDLAPDWTLIVQALTANNKQPKTAVGTMR